MMARWQESFACGCGVRAKRTLAGEHFAHDDAKRVLEMNERVAANLHKMITALEREATLIEVAELMQAE